MTGYTPGMKLRNSAKGVVVHEGRVLLTRCVDHTGDWYCCPAARRARLGLPGA
ncbi:MAG: hypothetical protein ICCCNLDF_02070 [Planctomycetes bacterium]|nr:hypothetical protein [Planctomycetota bacterium]